MDFEIVGSISNIDSVAVGAGIHDLPRLRKQYGKGNLKKLKGFAIPFTGLAKPWPQSKKHH
jgi:hypothetical protein